GRSGSRRSSPRVLPHMSWEMSNPENAQQKLHVTRADAERLPARTWMALGDRVRISQKCDGARFTNLRGALRSIPNCTTTHVDGEHMGVPRGVRHGVGDIDRA